MEKMLVCDALDERDFLRKKILKAIDTTHFVGAKRIKDSKVGAIPETDFVSSAKSDYQSIKDMIKRYQSIDIAITESNANTMVTTRSGKTMTRAAAIALRKSFSGVSVRSSNFTERLLAEMSDQYDQSLSMIGAYNKKADSELENFKLNITGRDGNKKLTDEDITMLEKLTADLRGDLVDPLGIKKELDNLTEEYSILVKEIDTAIKISNATTSIEF